MVRVSGQVVKVPAADRGITVPRMAKFNGRFGDAYQTVMLDKVDEFKVGLAVERK
jgi:hypothetical protein